MEFISINVKYMLKNAYEPFLHKTTFNVNEYKAFHVFTHKETLNRFRYIEKSDYLRLILFGYRYLTWYIEKTIYLCFKIFDITMYYMLYANTSDVYLIKYKWVFKYLLKTMMPFACFSICNNYWNNKKMYFDKSFNTHLIMFLM